MPAASTLDEARDQMAVLVSFVMVWHESTHEPDALSLHDAV